MTAKVLKNALFGLGFLGYVRSGVTYPVRVGTSDVVALRTKYGPQLLVYENKLNETGWTLISAECWAVGINIKSIRFTWKNDIDSSQR
jgi:hypothetical protein